MKRLEFSQPAACDFVRLKCRVAQAHKCEIPFLPSADPLGGPGIGGESAMILNRNPTVVVAYSIMLIYGGLHDAFRSQGWSQGWSQPVTKRLLRIGFTCPGKGSISVVDQAILQRYRLLGLEQISLARFREDVTWLTRIRLNLTPQSIDNVLEQR